MLLKTPELFKRELFFCIIYIIYMALIKEAPEVASSHPAGEPLVREFVSITGDGGTDLSPEIVTIDLRPVGENVDPDEMSRIWVRRGGDLARFDFPYEVELGLEGTKVNDRLDALVIKGEDLRGVTKDGELEPYPSKYHMGTLSSTLGPPDLGTPAAQGVIRHVFGIHTEELGNFPDPSDDHIRNEFGLTLDVERTREAVSKADPDRPSNIRQLVALNLIGIRLQRNGDTSERVLGTERHKVRPVVHWQPEPFHFDFPKKSKTAKR